jgi:hypothetical protein
MLSCVRSEAYDEGNLEHEVQLLDLWRLLQPDRQLDKEREGSTAVILLVLSQLILLTLRAGAALLNYHFRPNTISYHLWCKVYNSLAQCC